jgi:protein CMS1
VQHLERIVIDASHINEKKRGILEMKETEIPLTQLLAQDAVRGRYGASEAAVQLLFF